MTRASYTTLTDVTLRYVGSQHGLHPAEPFEAALHESLMCAVEDLRARR